MSARAGIGVTAAEFPCFRPTNGGTDVGWARQPVYLAVTDDGGRVWKVVGTKLPVTSNPGGSEQVVAASPDNAWVLTGNQHVFSTSDGGEHWTRAPLGDSVTQITAIDHSIWAVGCVHQATSRSPLACRPKLWRARLRDGSWLGVPSLHVVAQDPSYVHFAGAGSDVVLAILDAKSFRVDVLTSRDLGGRWSDRAIGAWDHQKYLIPAALIATRPDDFWLLALGGAAAGSSTKELLVSTNGGSRWTTVSQAPSLTGPVRRGQIPLEEPSALAAGSRTRLWLTLTNGLAESADAGRYWTNVPSAFDPAGWETSVDVLNPTHAWVLAAGAGMWRTTNARRWQAIRPQNTQ